MCDILRLKSIQVDIDGTVYVQTDSGLVPFKSIGDGRLTVACLVVDMIARWIHRQRAAGQPIEADFLRQMTGFALIDEIGLHLHPKQQTTIVGDLRRLFPRMSFVATTHNPLCLLGARAEETWTLRRDGDRISAVPGKGLPALMTAAQVLSQWFGIGRTFPDPLGIGEKLQRLSFLVGSGSRSPAEEQEMYSLVRLLREAKTDPGWVALPEDSENHGVS
jgi:predicted ATP-binding protein involved in virulence